jgi:selT/selW/selH-like putative selenoprotein
MDIKIYYCGEWNYLPEASRLEDELKGNFSNVNIKLNEGSGGIFKVIVNDKIIFDKLDIEHRFPKSNEITTRIKSL